MGRPLHKDVNGVEVTGTFGTKPTAPATDKRAGIRVQYHDGSLKDDGVIVKQRGAKTYVCATNTEALKFDNLTQTTPNFVGVLQKDAPAAAGQIRILGYLAGSGETQAGGIAIAKLKKRVAFDFDGNRYTWEMVNFEDSTGDSIKLTPVA
jgi:hypothetical protein